MSKYKEQQKKDNKDIKNRLQECEKQKQEYLAGWQRSRADFLNYQKQERERMGELIKNARSELLLEILKIFDNLERATNQHFLNEGFNKEKQEEFIQGLQQIKKQFEHFLKKQGVEQLKTIAKKFNPDLHEAIGQIEAKDKESGTIAEEVEKGYLLNGQLLRPAKVKVVK